MANVFNRTTGEYLTSVNTPDYPTEDWIINPDVSALKGIVDLKYWKASGETVIEMSQAEKDIVDTALLPGIKKNLKELIDIKTNELILEGSDYTGVGSTTETPNGTLLALTAINEGKALKALVDVATTKAEANAVTDSRTLTTLQTVVDVKIIERP